MSTPSQWPLTADAVRYITPEFMLRFLGDNRLTRACYPTSVGYYPNAERHHMARQGSEHDNNLVIYCSEGQGWVRTADFNGPVRPGDILILPRACQHEYAADEQSPWSIYWLHFSGLEADALIRALDYRPEQPLVQLGAQGILEADFRRLISLRQSGFQHSVFTYAASLVRQILCHLAVEIRTSTAISRHNFNLDKIQGLMMENIEGNLNLDTLAAEARLSRYHFSAKYKQLSGYPPIKHFIHMKMERACHLLDNTQLAIADISHRLGYEDPLYFSRLFSKVIGQSPRDYRQQRQVAMKSRTPGIN